MATKKSDPPPKRMNLGTYLNLVGRKAHGLDDLVAFGAAYRKAHTHNPEQFPAYQYRVDWERSFEAWLQLKNGAPDTPIGESQGVIGRCGHIGGGHLDPAIICSKPAGHTGPHDGEE